MDPNTVDAYEPKNRRQFRSAIAYQAAEIYLSKQRVQQAFHAIALADANGLPLVFVGAKFDAELLALWGALDETERLRYRGDIDALCHDAVCVTRRIQIDEATYSLTGIGQADGFGATVESDLRRIFGASAPLSH